MIEICNAERVTKAILIPLPFKLREGYYKRFVCETEMRRHELVFDERSRRMAFEYREVGLRGIGFNTESESAIFDWLGLSITEVQMDHGR